MKIAKKVLAVLMAVAMIAGLSAMAFAADASSVVLVAGEPDEDGVMEVAVYFKNAVGLKSWDLAISYDDKVLEFDSVDYGTDAKSVNDGSKSNSVTHEFNSEEEPHTVLYSGYFKETLWSTADFAASAKAKKTVSANGENFNVATLTFVVIDEKAANTAFEVAVRKCDGATVSGGKATAALKEEEKTPVNPTPADDKKDNTKTEDGTKAANPSTGDEKSTGDNMALAAVAGVALLAGAAFIVSKKRK
ncbi:MAG: LPXTG cell wall anchor domain-containing protein [Clostridia bacterium]|nr:LPXTG cell wall anchor domain-containing protein [Clostridia bacterium]